MTQSRIGWAGLLLCLLAALLPRPAEADEAGATEDAPSAEERIARLEALVRAQASQLQRLEAALNKAQSAPAASAEGASSSGPTVAPLPPARAGLTSPATRLPAPAAPAATAPGVSSVHGGPALQHMARAPEQLVGATPPPATVVSADRGLKLSEIQWSGYLTALYRQNSAENSYFNINRFVLGLDAQITDCIDLTAEIEYEHGGIGGGRDGEIELEHLDITWRLHDAFSPKIGALLIPFARYNKYHDDPFNDFTVRPVTARFFVPTGWGQPGVGAEGVFQVGPRARLGYDVVISRGFDDNFTPNGGTTTARASWKLDNNEGKQIWGRLHFAQDACLVDYFEAGLSGTWGTYDDADENNLYGFALDLLVREGPFELQGEYIQYTYERDAADPVDAIEGSWGLWVQLAYHFMPCAWQKCRTCLATGTSHFTLAVRYEEMDLDDNRRGAALNDDQRRIGVALNYRLTERTVFRIDYTLIDPEIEDDREEFTFSFSSYF